MKKLFLVDFDGTIIKQDFYLNFIDEYSLHELNNKLLSMVKERALTSYDYLDKILSAVEIHQSELDNLVNNVKPDDYFFDFLNALDSQIYDIAIISAGNSYYIDRFLSKYNLEHICVYANKGAIENGRLVMKSVPSSEYYCSYYGISKKKVLLLLRDKYDEIYYIGDGKADFEPAVMADMVFAKRRLAELLRNSGHSFNEFNSFKDIISALKISNGDNVS